jgi:hypothetical protein
MTLITPRPKINKQNQRKLFNAKVLAIAGHSTVPVECSTREV